MPGIKKILDHPPLRFVIRHLSFVIDSSFEFRHSNFRASDLNKPRRIGLFFLLLFSIGFGCNVELRGALLHERHTDAGTYFSAAWSIRTGSDPYFARDRNGWHYTYPPLLAVLMSPLADAPPTMHRYGLLPYSLSVGLWYVLNVLFLVVGVDQLARAMVGTLNEPGTSAHLLASQWWTLFFWPVLLGLPVICRSVVRGQVGPMWLMLLCMTAACIIRKKPMQAGLWLAGAICLKLIPIFLLLYPLWRRSTRMLIGTGVGLLLGLIVIPMTAMGPKQFAVASRHYLQSIVIPGVTGGRMDPIVEHEIIDPRTSDTQSFANVLMNTSNIFLGTGRMYTPPAFARAGHWIIATILIAMTLISAGFVRNRHPIDDAIFFGILCVIMLPIAPTCHPHYFILMIPLVMAVLATSLESPPLGQSKNMWILLLAALPLSHMLTFTTGYAWMRFLRDTGLVLWVAVLFCIAAMWLLHQRRDRFEFVQ